MPAELPAHAAFASLGDIGFPTPVGPFFDPAGNRHLVQVKHVLTATGVNEDIVLSAVEVHRLAARQRRRNVAAERSAVHRSVISVSGRIGHGARVGPADRERVAAEGEINGVQHVRPTGGERAGANAVDDISLLERIVDHQLGGADGSAGEVDVGGGREGPQVHRAAENLQLVGDSQEGQGVQRRPIPDVHVVGGQVGRGLHGPAISNRQVVVHDHFADDVNRAGTPGSQVVKSHQVCANGEHTAADGPGVHARSAAPTGQGHVAVFHPDLTTVGEGPGDVQRVAVGGAHVELVPVHVDAVDAA